MSLEFYKTDKYFMNNTTWHIEDSSWKAGLVFNILNRANLRPIDIVEVGCGAGAVLAELQRKLPLANFLGMILRLV